MARALKCHHDEILDSLAERFRNLGKVFANGGIEGKRVHTLFDGAYDIGTVGEFLRVKSREVAHHVRAASGAFAGRHYRDAIWEALRDIGGAVDRVEGDLEAR